MNTPIAPPSGKLTRKEMVLIAAAKLERDDGLCPFTTAQLVVTAWTMFQRELGLEGFHATTAKESQQ